MSSSTFQTYYVDVNELLRRARLAAASQAARDARGRVEAALAAVREAEWQHGAGSVEIAAPPAAGVGTTEALERYVALADRFVIDAQAAIGRAHAVGRLRALIAETPAASAPVGDWSAELRARAASARNDREAPAVAQGVRLSETVERVVTRLQAALPPEEQRRIDALAGEIVACGDAARAEALLSELRLQVQRTNERAARARHDAEVATNLALQLGGLDGDDVVAVRAQLQDVQDRRLPMRPDLVAEVDAVRKRAEKRADDAYVATVLDEELTRLGYVTGPTFTTLFTRGGESLLRRPEQPEYGVEIGVDSAAGTIDLNVVRLALPKSERPAATAENDKRAEERWCRDHDALRKALARRGIRGRLVSNVPAGARALPLARDEQTNGSRRARRAEALRRET
jgi:hypothetical protein